MSDWIWEFLETTGHEFKKEKAIDVLKQRNRIANSKFIDEFYLYHDFIVLKDFELSLLDFFKNKDLQKKYNLFWQYFINKYPGTDNEEIQKIFIEIGI